MKNKLLLIGLLVTFLTTSIAEAQRRRPGGIGQRSVDSPEVYQRHSNYQKHAQMQKNSSLAGSRWVHAGPYKTSGRITDVAAHPSDTETFYVATASGGLWKTTTGGEEFFPIYENGPTTTMGAVSVAPSDPNILYLGTGESNISRSAMAGDGVYKSVDAGKTWKYVGLGDTHRIQRIVIHPTNPDIAYVAAGGHEYTHNRERGVYKTINGGQSWQHVFAKDLHTGATELAMDPSDPNTLYLGTAERVRQPWNDPIAGPSSGIWKSTDAGKTWRRLSKGLPNFAFCERIGLDVCEAEPNVVYAVINNHNAKPGAVPKGNDAYGNPLTKVVIGADVYRSDDKGETWTRCEGSDKIGGTFATYGWYFGQIRVSSDNPDEIYVMGLGVKRSTNGGKTFDAPVRTTGGDHHTMWINPKDGSYIINGHDHGVAVSTDRGKTFKGFKNLPVVQLYNVGFSMEKPFKIYSSIQDHGSQQGTIDLNNGVANLPKIAWARSSGGEASYHAVDPTNGNIYYSEGFYGSISRTDTTSGRRVSKKIMPTAVKGEPPLRGQWLAPFIISPHDNKTIYHGMQYLYKSTNQGDTWTKISPDLSNFDPNRQGSVPYAVLTTISESPVKQGLIYVGTDDGNVQVTKNDGKTWELIVHGVPLDRWVSRVEASRFEEGTVYMTKNGKRNDDFNVYAYRSTNYGQDWEDIGTGIPGGPVNVIREDPRNPNVLYVGTDTGVYASLDRGESWQVLGSGLPSAYVHDLIVHPRDDVMVIATHGRGAWVLDLSNIRSKTQTNVTLSENNGN